ncbi:unnamed protein product, partial [Linum tenue]
MVWYRKFTKRWVTKRGAVIGSLVDGLELASMTLENEPEDAVPGEKISFLKKLFKNLLSCSREIRRDVIAYPPAPAPPRPSSHA